MKLTSIEIKEGNLRAEMEETKDGNYNISIDRLDDEGGFESTVVKISTYETTIDSIIELLTFLKNYNFEQK